MGRASCLTHPCTSGLNSNPCLLREGGKGKYHPPPHTPPTHKLYMPTLSNTPPDPAFQMGLFPASVKLLPGLAVFTSTPFTFWILSPLQSGLLTSETCFSGHRHLLIANQPTTFHQTHLLICIEQTCPSLIRQPTPFFSLAVHCESPLLPLLSLLTL